MNVVVVELPAKAKTINKYLGSGYEVLASFGHVRDLPAKDGSVDPEHDFRMIWEVDAKSQKRLADIARAVKGAEQADPRDRPRPRGRGDLLARARSAQGKARAQGADGRARRVQRHHQAGGARGDEASARASTARWSTPIWRAARSTIWSASRSRRCCGASCRARARPAACSRWRCGWSATASSRSRNSSRANTGRWSRRWRRRAAKRSRRGWSAPTARKSSGSTSARAPRPRRSSRRWRPRRFTVATVEAKPAKRNPPPPFTTSTLQQEASRKLGFAPAHTMRIAQRLYEGVEIGGETVGLITYMRTDGVQIAEEAITAARRRDRRRLRRALRARRAAPLPDQGQERPGSARGDPPDRSRPPPAARRNRCSIATRPGSTS